MKSGDLRAMSLDQLEDEVLKLAKERFNFAFSGQPASWRTLRACVKSVVTSRVSRPSPPRSVPPRSDRAGIRPKPE